MQKIREIFPDVEVIAGVATGAIAQGALVAEVLGLPFNYVRSSPKDHGRENIIEGQVFPGRKVVIIEDLVSTGSSSLKAFHALCEAGYKVLGMVAVFTYGFPEADSNFRMAGCQLETLSNYEVLIDEAILAGYILPEQMEVLQRWRVNPSQWTP